MCLCVEELVFWAECGVGWEAGPALLVAFSPCGGQGWQQPVDIFVASEFSSGDLKI